jgi:ATP-dependent helicase Lhr and Lhr-like helicase
MLWNASRDFRFHWVASPDETFGLAAIDQLVQEGVTCPLADETRVLYILPLKARSNDIHKNLELPLNRIRDVLFANAFPDVPIRSMVRTGDTTTPPRRSGI